MAKAKAKGASKTRRRGGAASSGPALTIVPLGGGRGGGGGTACSSGGRGSRFRGHKLSAGYRRGMLDAAFSM